MQDIIQNVLDIETREETLNELLKKRDNLLQELQEVNSNTPVVIENNKKALLFKYNNQEYLNVYNTEVEKIEIEQRAMILNLRSGLKDKMENLLISDKYRQLQKELSMTRDETINYIYDELIAQKMKEVEFLN
jgi:hypothetical protein